MKKIFLTFSLIAFSSIAFSQEIKFEETVHDYGKIEYKGNGTTQFVYTNVGDKPLVITKAKGSCGCTVPTFSREPLMPGAKDSITVKYDTKRPGNFSKSITVTSNSVVGNKSSDAGLKRTMLKIKGNVGPRPTAQEQGLLNQNSSPMMPKSN